MREGLPQAPLNIQALPLDARGFPIPWFVYIDDDGKEDFRIIGPGKLGGAFKKGLCWICGQPIGRLKTFVIGPMCAINRVSAEPPSHLECATYAAKACPFLTRPLAKRNDRDLPEGHQPAPGIAILRNPGVTLVWACLTYKPFFPDGGGVLFKIGNPLRTNWYANGREATCQEVAESIESGFPILLAEAQKEGKAALVELGERYAQAVQLLPEDPDRRRKRDRDRNPVARRLNP
jgi:hypothetical protein